MAKETQLNAYDFMIRNARPLDLARWRYHFEQGPLDDVIKALQSYQNPDGGFGHALEPDAWNPTSSPIQTWVALEILEELNVKDPIHPIIKSILNYLDSGADFDGHFWFNTVAANNDYPHAPWWHTRSKLTSFEDYNPTAYLAGFILNYADPASTLYQKGKRIAQEAIDCFNLEFNAMEMHMVACFVHMAHDILTSNTEGLAGFNSFEFHLNARVKALIDHDLGQWDNAYVCKPSRFITDQTSPYFHANQKAINAECLYLEQTQTPGDHGRYRGNGMTFLINGLLRRTGGKPTSSSTICLYSKTSATYPNFVTHPISQCLSDETKRKSLMERFFY